MTDSGPRVDPTDEQVSRFEEQGFLAVERVTTEAEVERVRDIYDRLFRERTGGVAGGYFDLSRPYDSPGDDRLPQVLRPELAVPDLHETLFFRNARRIAARLLATDADRLEAWGHMILKPAHVGGELPWHQDEAYWDPRLEYRALGIWMPLDPATPRSGCLEFVPGSHRRDVLPHRHIGGDPSVHGLEALEPEVDGARAVPVPVGGATVHHCRMLHRSGPNGTARAPGVGYRVPAPATPAREPVGATVDRGDGGCLVAPAPPLGRPSRVSWAPNREDTMGRVEGKIAIVTGAASGIGAAGARILASEGARVGCADLNGEGAEAIAKEITQAGGEAFAIPLDATDPEQNRSAVEAVRERYGSLDVAYLNAGIAAASSVLDTTLEEWDSVNAVNLRGVFLGLQASARVMKDTGGGSIVITSSGAGLRGGPMMGTYCATKHGVLGLMKCAAVDLAPYQIRVNAVCPGVIDTPILGPIHKNREILDGVFARAHPIGRVGQPEEVGRLVLFLASDDSSFITGTAHPVDGGMHSTFGGAPDSDVGRLGEFLNQD